MSSIRHARLRWPIALLVGPALLLAACGSGSSPTESGSVADFGSLEDRLLDLVNTSRQEAGLGPVASHGLISAVAEDHSQWMAQSGGLTHQGPNGEQLGDRLQAASVRYSRAGENLGFVQGANDAALHLHNELMRSGEHRANILGPGYQVAGIGVAVKGGQVWATQIFISP
jgi:uncharacterized protein YkwD